MIAIVPAAGKGTRMHEFTHGAPKELLPYRGRPVLGWVIEEAIRSGASQVVVVSSRDKPEVDALARSMGAEVRYQTEPRGLGDAVAIGAAADESALVFAADVVFPVRSPMGRVSDALRNAWAVLPVREIPVEEARKYGVVEFEEGAVSRIIEKPKRGESNSGWVIAGRWGLSAEAISALLAQRKALAESGKLAQGELYLTPLLQANLAAGKTLAAVPLLPDEKLVDCGDPDVYRATLGDSPSP